MIVISIVFLLFLIMGAPIVFSFAFSSFVYIVFVSDLPLNMFASVLYSSLDSFPLLAIPLFLYAGELMSKGGISKRIITFSEAIVGKVKGYLGLITILASALFSAISGSGIATVAAVGGMLIPEMKNSKYPAGYAATLSASAAFLGIIIPPSIPMVMYGFITSTSIGDLFVGGIVPGILLIIGFSFINLYYSRKFDLIETREEDKMSEEKMNRIKLIFVTGKTAFWALLMPVIIIGGIYGGFFTPTESAVVAVIYSILVGSLIYRELNMTNFLNVSFSSAMNTAMLMITLVFATVFSRLLTVEQIPQKIATYTLQISDKQWVILLIVIAFLLFIGMLMDAITGVILVAPIVYPIVVTGLGVDPVHLGVIVVVTLAVGLITPPMAINLFLAGKIANASMKSILNYIPAFIIVSLIVILIITFLPSLVLFLPNLVN